MNTDHNQQDRERALAALRIIRLEHTLVLAYVDELGLLLRDGLIAPWGVMAAVADLTGTGNREASE